MNEIDNIPAADVEEVKHGEWRKEVKWCNGIPLFIYTCPKCKAQYDAGFMAACMSRVENERDKFPRCPNCGTKMDGKKEI